MSNLTNGFYDKKYVFDVVYDLSRVDSYNLFDRIHERVTVYENHSKYSYAKCATYLFKRHPYIKEIESIELLYSEPNN